MVTTRSHHYTASEPSSSIPHSQTIEEKRRRWAALLRNQHYQPVIKEVLAEELPKYANGNVTLPKSLSSITHECILIITSAPLVFAAAIEGNLVQRMLTDTILQTEYRTIQQRAHHQPSIYLHILADEQGVAPTPTQYLAISDMIADYISGAPSEHAFHIDNTTPSPVPESLSAQGRRKYLHATTRGNSPTHITTLKRLITGIQSLYHATTPPSHRNLPLPYPPTECGYSLNSHIRLAQHRKRHSSNYTMNLVEDICTYLHATHVFSQRFSMHQFIIYLIFRPQQAAIAEIFVSGLLQVWVDGGGGFNAYPAGRSVSSVRSVEDGLWREWERWAWEEGGLKERMEEVRERVAGDVEGLEWEDEVAWRDAVEGDGEEDEEEDEEYVDEGFEDEDDEEEGEENGYECL